MSTRRAAATEPPPKRSRTTTARGAHQSSDPSDTEVHDEAVAAERGGRSGRASGEAGSSHLQAPRSARGAQEKESAPSSARGRGKAPAPIEEAEDDEDEDEGEELEIDLEDVPARRTRGGIERSAVEARGSALRTRRAIGAQQQADGSSPAAAANKIRKVIVVGAGYAGITAAKTLRELGYSVHDYEAEVTRCPHAPLAMSRHRRPPSLHLFGPPTSLRGASPPVSPLFRHLSSAALLTSRCTLPLAPQVHVLEGRSRIGGRVHSLATRIDEPYADEQVTVELGAAVLMGDVSSSALCVSPPVRQPHCAACSPYSARAWLSHMVPS